MGPPWLMAVSFPANAYTTRSCLIWCSDMNTDVAILLAFFKMLNIFEIPKDANEDSK